MMTKEECTKIDDIEERVIFNIKINILLILWAFSLDCEKLDVPIINDKRERRGFYGKIELSKYTE